MLALLVVALWWRCGRQAAVSLGTFNIRTFMDTHTDPRAVAAALVELDADAFAVQEIRDIEPFERVVADAGARLGRDYAATLMPYCDAYQGRPIYLGVVVDRARLERVGQRWFADGERCAPGQPSGMLVVLGGQDGRRFALASVHMKAGGAPQDHAVRRRQWGWLTAALPRWMAELGAPVVVVGDFNSTGYLQVDSDERRFIDRTLAEHQLQLPTGGLDCTEYWQDEPGHYAVSLLDHVLAPEVLTFTEPRVLGMCAALACEPQERAPDGFDEVSDHCPVKIALVDGT